MKTCSSCNELKDMEQFYFVKKRGKIVQYCYCKPCSRLRYKVWQSRNREIRLLKSYKRKFNLSIDQSLALMAKQDDVCAICGERDKRRALSLDHDHGTNKVRGFLCDMCNIGLGKFKDNEELLRKAADYLKEHRDCQASA